jgi:Protein of unknown function (DUF1573).
MKQLLLFFLFSVFCVYSCKDNHKKENIEKIVSEWVGKEIKFPEATPCYLYDKDTLSELCNEHFQKEFKVLLYVDSAGCSDCRLKLPEWKQLMEESDNLFHGKVGFLLFFQPKSIKDAKYLFAKNGFRYPVFMDVNDKINDLNHFPQTVQYQCFLLDENNKVLMIGNPALNMKIWELYKSQISGTEKLVSKTLTSVMLDKGSHHYGTIRQGTSNHAVFTITNTGSSPLIINHVSASCGCTAVMWEKQPIEPGAATTISVEMKPDETGYFNKTVEVYCNIDESPLRLTLVGLTE